MSEAKHTPGPWSAYPYDGCVMIANTSGEFIEYPLNGKTFEGEAEANAMLIAAAPAMLEALKGVLAVADRKTREFDAARAAVAAAQPVRSRKVSE